LRRAWIVEPFDPRMDRKTLDDYFHITKEPSDDGEGEAHYRVAITTSDFGDNRAKPDEKLNCWALRRRQRIYGCESIQADGISVKLYRNQRVYGAEDYNWAAIRRRHDGVRRALDGA
jgi:hypothetical protein